MTTCFLAPDPIQSTQFIPGGNFPANGGQLFFYRSGTTTKQTVYKDPTGSTAWSNPIVLDSGGNLPSGGEVWFQTGQTFTVVYAPANDSDPPVSPYWTKDNLYGVNDIGMQSSYAAVSGAYTLLSSRTITSVVSTLTFSSDVAWSSYRRIDFIMEGVRPANNASLLYARVSNNGGASFAASGYQFALSGFAATSASGVMIVSSATMATAGTLIPLADNVNFLSNVSFSNYNGTLQCHIPGVAEAIKYFSLDATYLDANQFNPNLRGSAFCTSIAGSAISGITFGMIGGNISTGSFKAYGVP